MAVSTDPMMGLCRSLRIAVLALLAALCGTVRTAHSQTHSARAHRSKSPSNVDWPVYEPPWGTLNAIDLNIGKYLWKIPLGEYPALAASGLANTGSENYGGPIVTAGDVLFIGATVYDKKFRAFDSLTGKLLWQTVLPNSAIATPATYMIDGKQYVVVSAGGGKDPKRSSGSVYVAFAPP